MDKVMKNNKIGKIFLIIASIFMIVASLACFIIAAVEFVGALLLGELGTALGGSMSGISKIVGFVPQIVMLVIFIIQFVLAIVCLIRTIKSGSMNMPKLLYVITLVMVLPYFVWILSKMTSGMVSDLSEEVNLDLTEMLFGFVTILPLMATWSKIHDAKEKKKSPILIKHLTTLVLCFGVFFLAVNAQANMQNIGTGVLGKIIFALNVSTLCLFIVEGISTIIYTIIHKNEIRAYTDEELEKEVINNDGVQQTEKRYIEKGTKSVAKLVFSIIFIALFAVTLIWELVDIIPMIEYAKETMHLYSMGLGNIPYLYYLLCVFGLAVLMAHFIWCGFGLVLGKKEIYHNVTKFLMLLGVYLIFARLVPSVYAVIEIAGFDASNSLILVPIIATIVFIVSVIVGACLGRSASKEMKQHKRSKELMKKTAITNTIVVCASFVLYLIACIFALSLHYIPAILAIIVICVIYWLEVKNPREEYIIVKFDVEKTEEEKQEVVAEKTEEVQETEEIAQNVEQV